METTRLADAASASLDPDTLAPILMDRYSGLTTLASKCANIKHLHR